jgi:hypothetical protein
MKKKNKVIISLSRGVPESATLARLRLKVMDYNKRIDDRCARGQVVSNDDSDVKMVSALREELSTKAAKEILGNSPK